VLDLECSGTERILSKRLLWCRPGASSAGLCTMRRAGPQGPGAQAGPPALPANSQSDKAEQRACHGVTPSSAAGSEAGKQVENRHGAVTALCSKVELAGLILDLAGA